MNDQFSQYTQIDQTTGIKTTETFGQVEPNYQIPEPIAMMPPGSDGLVFVIAATATALTATGTMCRGLADLIRALRGDDHDRDE